MPLSYIYIYVHTIEAGYHRRYCQYYLQACHALHDGIHIVRDDAPQGVHRTIAYIGIDIDCIVSLS